MTITLRRLTKLCALSTAILYVVSMSCPAALWAETSSKSNTSSKNKDQKIESSGYPAIFIGPGDILFITVYGENGQAGGFGGGGGTENTQLTTDYQVDSDGNITFPFLSTVHLGGFTPTQASDKLARLLHKPRKVTVLIKESNTYWVSILGNVGKPGKYQIHGKPTLLSALAEAGGPLPDTDWGGTILIHKGNKQKVDLGNFLHNEGKTETEPYLYPGDVLAVSKSGAPTLGEIAIVASILASAAVVTVELSNLRR